jgi:hypothetical protein
MSWGFAFRLRQRLKGSLWVVPFLGAALGPVLGLACRSFAFPDQAQVARCRVDIATRWAAKLRRLQGLPVAQIGSSP